MKLTICRALRACYWQFKCLTVENQLKCCWCSRKHLVFNVEDRILVENYINAKFTELKIVYFLTSPNYLLKKLRDASITARQPGSGRRQSARTVENVDTVNDLVLSHKRALKCIKPRVKLQGRPAFIIPVSVQHYSSGFSIKMFEETACAGTHCGNCVH